MNRNNIKIYNVEEQENRVDTGEKLRRKCEVINKETIIKCFRIWHSPYKDFFDIKFNKTENYEK